MPFTFMQAEHLVAWGVVVEADNEQLMLDVDALTAWRPPPAATDDYVLGLGPATGRQVVRIETGTRIDALGRAGAVEGT